MNSLSSGTLAGIGSFRCTRCDYAISLAPADSLPTCPGCGGEEFTRASLFATVDHTAEPAASVGRDPWLLEVREAFDEPGQYLAYEDGEGPRVVALTREWTRIGRSLAADIRFDDPTVSRRHALIVRRPDGVRVLDDRSLNGVFVNGERLEWGELSDGDELIVGRHRLHFLDVPVISGMREQPDTVAEPA